VINQGKIAETGSHEELMDRHGRYYTLLTRQIEPSPSNSTTMSKTLSSDPSEETMESEDSYFLGKEHDSDITPEAEQNFSIYLRILRMSKDSACLLALTILSAAAAAAIMPVFGFLLAKEVEVILSELDGGTMKRE
jgi:hypothetical protein